MAKLATKEHNEALQSIGETVTELSQTPPFAPFDGQCFQSAVTQGATVRCLGSRFVQLRAFGREQAYGVGDNPIEAAFFDGAGHYIITVMRSDRANFAAYLDSSWICLY